MVSSHWPLPGLCPNFKTSRVTSLPVDDLKNLNKDDYVFVIKSLYALGADLSSNLPANKANFSVARANKSTAAFRDQAAGLLSLDLHVDPLRARLEGVLGSPTMPTVAPRLTNFAFNESSEKSAANAKRFTDRTAVELNFRMNCKDVVGRECTAGEKADVLSWLLSIKP